VSQLPIVIRPKDRDAIINSLRAGVVPRIGQQYYQVGRAQEVKALLRDLEVVSDQGSAVRFVIGEYGSGKTFFLQLVRSMALERKLVTAGADLSPDRRLFASGGQARSLYRELMINLATRSRPEGGAMESIVERFVASAIESSKEKGTRPDEAIRQKLAVLEEMVGGYDFATVIHAYWEGFELGRDQQKADAIRWLRGEFSTKTDARNCLNVRTIVDDSNVYDYLKLFGRFVELAGYSGFYVILDEMVNLYKLSQTTSRTQNYEQLLRIVNDCLQGGVRGLGFLFAGTPEFLMDPRRGIFSYEALRSRLAENGFSEKGQEDFSGPVIRLASLTPEDMYLLLQKLTNIQASGDQSKLLVDDPGLRAFLDHCNKKIGAAFFRTPRNSIKAFLDLLAMLEQYPEKRWTDFIEGVPLGTEKNPDHEDIEEDDGLAEFKL
jgi:hypothetical protein